MFTNAYIRIGLTPFASCQPLQPSLLASLFVLPLGETRSLRDVLEQTKEDLPWSESYLLAPEQTVASLSLMLSELMMASSDLRPETIDCESLPLGSRARFHLEALRDLWAANLEIMPPDLAVLKAFLACDIEDVLQPIRLVWDRDWPFYTPLEFAVLERLEAHFGGLGPDDEDVQRFIISPKSFQASSTGLLGHVQRHLLDPDAKAVVQDDSLSVLCVRDCLTECEVAIGIIQKWLSDEPDLKASDIGVILPQGAHYSLYFSDNLTRAGLQASSLPILPNRRNMAAEAVLNFLQARRPLPPSMALASLYSSPLMAWSPSEGMALAHFVMQRDFKPRMVTGFEGRRAQLWSLIRKPSPSSSAQLKEEIRLFSSLLSEDKAFSGDVEEVRQLCLRLISDLDNSQEEAEASLESLINIASNYQPQTSIRGAHYLGGLRVFMAHEMPKRPVKKLIILGFNEGSYPRLASGNPFFLDSEIGLIEECAGLKLRSQAKRIDADLTLFMRQLMMVSEQAILLFSERDRDGKSLSVSSSLPLVARLIDGISDPMALVVPLSEGKDTVWDRLVNWRPGQDYRPISDIDIPIHFQFDRDLLRLRQNDDGGAKAQSPSRLETLLVSPLAWLLGELDAKPISWLPEQLDIMLRGSLAHEVFELLFIPGMTYPSDDEIEKTVPSIFDEQMRRTAPFLKAAVWKVERLRLESEIITSAKRWSRVLRALKAEIVDNEFWLSGSLFNHPIHGKADCLLLLNDGLPIIVDFKKSNSTQRRERLKKGWDLQVDLYRKMGVKEGQDQKKDLSRLIEALKGQSTLVAYHTLNDGQVLLNGVDEIACAEVEIIKGEIATNALQLIGDRFNDLRAGRLRTNSEADKEYFQKKAFLGIYALEEGGLVSAFMRFDDKPSVPTVGGDDHD